MLSLGILGGIYAFHNPLQGCLLVRGGVRAGWLRSGLGGTYLRSLGRQDAGCALLPACAAAPPPACTHPPPRARHPQGPILLSLLSVFYNLHSEFMGGGSGSADGRPQHRLWSLTPASGPATIVQATPAWQSQQRRQQQQQQQQGQHVQLSGAPPTVLGPGLANGAHRASPQHSASLRIHVPSRLGELREHGDAHSPRAAPPTSASEDGSPGAIWQLPPPRLPSRSPSLSLRGPGVGAPAGPGSEGSVGNSFSFAALGSSAAKLHDD